MNLWLIILGGFIGYAIAAVILVAFRHRDPMVAVAWLAGVAAFFAILLAVSWFGGAKVDRHNEQNTVDKPNGIVYTVDNGREN